MAYVINIDGFIGDSGFMGGDCFTLKDLNRSLDKMPTNTKEVDVVINSGGGYVTEGFAIHDRLATLEQTVNTTTLGICGSIATVIAQAPKSQGKGGLRKGHQNSDYFVHNPSWSPQSPDPLEAEDLKRIYEDLKANEEKLINFYATTTGKEAEMFRAKMIEAKSLSMDEAQELGLIDKIISSNIQAATVYKFAAHIKTISPMSTFLDNFKKEFADFKTEIKAMFKPVIKNEKATSEEGDVIYFEGSLAVGTKVYTDEAMTMPCADKTLSISGTKYTIAGGEVTEVVEGTTAKTELELANEKISELTNQLAGKDAEIDSKINAAIASKESELTTKLNEAVAAKESELQNAFNAKFTAFQNKFFTGDKLNPEFIQAMKEPESGNPNPNTNETPMQIAARIKREKAEAAKK